MKSKLSSLILLVVTSLLFIAASPENYPKKTYEAKAIDRLTIKLDEGKVFISASEQNKTIKIIAINTDKKHRDRCDIEFEEDSNELVADADCQYSIVVYTPRDLARSSIHIGNGNVLVRNLHSRLVAKTGNGEINIENVKGEVDVSVGNGKIVASVDTNSFSAHAGNGQIVASGIIDSFEIGAGNGSVNLTLNDIRSVGEGDIKLASGPVSVQIDPSIEKKRVKGFGPISSYRLSKGDKRLDLKVISIAGKKDVSIMHQPSKD